MLYLVAMPTDMKLERTRSLTYVNQSSFNFHQWRIGPIISSGRKKTKPLHGFYVGDAQGNNRAAYPM